MAPVENKTLSPGLAFGLELGSPVQVGWQAIDVDEARSSMMPVAMSDIDASTTTNTLLARDRVLAQRRETSRLISQE